ncbi:hypothetical protein AgCh_020648 [Apium graveolens]
MGLLTATQRVEDKYVGFTVVPPWIMAVIWNKPGDLSEYIGAAKKIQVNQVCLTTSVQTGIDWKQEKINSSATTLTEKAVDNLDNIHDVIDPLRLKLIIISNVILLLTFIEFLLSLFDTTIAMK